MTKRKCWHEYPASSLGMASYPDWTTRMEPAEPFDAILTFDTFSRGRSSAVAWFITDKDTSAPMFLSNLQEIVHLLKDGQISGRWIVVKKGENYGIALEELPSAQ